MKPDKYEAAEFIDKRGGITRDEYGAYYVPSTDGSRTYIVSESGRCNCPAMKSICRHNLAAFRAIHPILQFRWAADYEWLRAAGELYKAEIEAMPKALQEECRSEYRAALARLSGRINRPVSKYVKSYSQGTHIIERRQEPLRLNGVEV
jgi:hypothetical protein